MDYKEKVIAMLNSKELSQEQREKLANVFPELIEKEDEKIRKEIIDFLELPHPQFVGKRDFKKWIAWIEKQSKKKSADEVLKIRQELYQSGYNDGYKHGQEDITKSLSIGENINHTDIKEKAHQIAWETLKDYDPLLSKEAWCEMAALDMASWLKREIDDAYLQGICDAKNEIEKQGKQTPADKVEPKFHEGDWIISNDKKSTYQVIEVKRGIYVIRDNVDNHVYHIGIEECEKSGRLWLINDANDGDVLASELSGSIFLFKGIKDNKIDFYCDYDITFEWSEQRFAINDSSEHYGSVEESQDIHPASKEQRDQLEKAITEAGYLWDSEKKELKKIEPKTLNADKVIEWLNNQACLGWIEDVEVDKFVEKFKKDFEI